MANRYKEFKHLNLPAIEKEILERWEQEKAFEKSVEIREEAQPFVFYEGPPSANGMPGIHHVMARALKDLVCRYKTMQGFKVERKGGWDTHGLPIELGVEKELGITKEDIGKTFSERLKAPYTAQPEQLEMHVMGDRVVLGTERDHPVTAGHLVRSRVAWPRARASHSRWPGLHRDRSRPAPERRLGSGRGRPHRRGHVR